MNTTHRIRAILNQSNSMSNRAQKDFSGFVRSLSIKEQETVAQILENNAAQCISSFQNEIGRLRRCARAGNIALYENFLDAFVKKFAAFDQRVDEQMKIEDIKRNITNITNARARNK